MSFPASVAAVERIFGTSRGAFYNGKDLTTYRAVHIMYRKLGRRKGSYLMVIRVDGNVSGHALFGVKGIIFDRYHQAKASG